MSRKLPKALAAQIAALTGVKTRGRSKFGNVRTTIDGHTFDSKREASRYVMLCEMQARGLVSELRLQVAFALHAMNGKKVCDYIADFVYLDDRGVRVVEDVKGMRTQVYKLKRKWLKAEYGIEILET